MSAPAVKVLLLDDDALVRDALGFAVEAQERLGVVRSEGLPEGEEALTRALEEKPDVVVVGVGLPRFAGLAVLERIGSDAPSAGCVALLHRRSEATLIRALDAGAVAAVSRDDRLDAFLDAIRRAAAREHYVSARLAPLLVSAAAGHAHGQLGIAALSRRERQVLAWVAEGLSTKEIAAKLGLSPRTVETHRMRVMEKLQVRRTSHLIRIAVEEGLLPNESS